MEKNNDMITPLLGHEKIPQRSRRSWRIVHLVAFLILASLILTLPAITKHKHPKHPKHGKCEGKVISGDLPEGYEPSDLVWHKNSGTLYIVSDGGRLAAVDKEGKLKGEWTLGKNFDLEGVALVPDRCVSFLQLMNYLLNLPLETTWFTWVKKIHHQSSNSTSHQQQSKGDGT